MIAPALSANEVGELLGYKGHTIRSMYRSGRFHAPIDPTLPAVAWRWSPRVVAAYIDGQLADEVAA